MYSTRTHLGRFVLLIGILTKTTLVKFIQLSSTSEAAKPITQALLAGSYALCALLQKPEKPFSLCVRPLACELCQCDATCVQAPRCHHTATTQCIALTHSGKKNPAFGGKTSVDWTLTIDQFTFHLSHFTFHIEHFPVEWRIVFLPKAGFFFFICVSAKGTEEWYDGFVWKLAYKQKHHAVPRTD